MAPGIPSAPGVRTISAPSASRIWRRSTETRVGHGQDGAIAPGGADEGEGDARVAARRLDDEGVLGDAPFALRRLDHRHADAVLDAAQRVERFELGDDGGVEVRRQPVEPHQRRVADELGDVVSDPCHVKASLLPSYQVGRLLAGSVCSCATSSAMRASPSGWRNEGKTFRTSCLFGTSRNCASRVSAVARIRALLRSRSNRACNCLQTPAYVSTMTVASRSVRADGASDNLAPSAAVLRESTTQ